ncbi:hypothetical protein BC940DRAFT_302069 [Gongronella butleri]|nr:hypothetical protein BC940DRAFT_302069 [Gongronella butleri]
MSATTDFMNVFSTKPKKNTMVSCSICQKPFVKASALKVHINTHTGEKPYQCTFQRCGRAFSVLSNLRRHIRACHQEREVAALLPRRGSRRADSEMSNCMFNSQLRCQSSTSSFVPLVSLDPVSSLATIAPHPADDGAKDAICHWTPLQQPLDVSFQQQMHQQPMEQPWHPVMAHGQFSMIANAGMSDPGTAVWHVKRVDSSIAQIYDPFFFGTWTAMNNTPFVGSGHFWSCAQL